MGTFRRNPAWIVALALLLGACQAAPLPVAVPALHQRDGVTLSVRPTFEEGRRLLATPPLWRVSDVTRLEVFLEVKVGEATLPIDAATGEPSATTDNPLVLRVAGPLEPNGMLTFGNLRANTEYRILARAYAGQTPISDDARSQAWVSVGTRESLDPVKLAVKLQDTPFGAEAQVKMALSGATTRLDRVRVLLSNPTEGVIAQVDVPKADLMKPLRVAALKPWTTYTVELQGFEAGNPTAIATASGTVPVLDDETGLDRAIALSVKGDLNLPENDYRKAAVDAAGNVYAMTFEQIFRYSPQGALLGAIGPIVTLLDLALASDGTSYLLHEFGSATTIAWRLRSGWRDGEVASEQLSSGDFGGQAVDAQGRYYLSTVAGQILVFEPGSRSSTQVLGGLNAPGSLLVAPDRSLYVNVEVDSASSKIVHFPWNGTGYGPGVLVADTGAARVTGMGLLADGRLAALLYQGDLVAIDRVTGAKTVLSSAFTHAWSMSQAPTGELFIAGGNKVTVF